MEARAQEDPTGRIDILVSRAAGAIIERFERDTGTRGVSEALLPHIDTWARKRFGPRPTKRRKR